MKTLSLSFSAVLLILLSACGTSSSATTPVAEEEQVTKGANAGSVHNSAIIAAPIDQVWAEISNFTNLDWAAGVVETVGHENKIAGDTVGCKRLLNGAFHETLTGVDADSYEFSYSIDQGPPPLGNPQNYIGTVKLYEVTADNTTMVVWTSSWDSAEGDTGEFCNPLYQALLSTMQKNIVAK